MIEVVRARLGQQSLLKHRAMTGECREHQVNPGGLNAYRVEGVHGMGSEMAIHCGYRDVEGLVPG